MSDPLFPPRAGRRSFLKTAATATAGYATLGALATPQKVHAAAPDKLRVLAWCEGTAPKSVYPDDVDGAIAAPLAHHHALAVRRARLGDPQAGLSDASLDATDVLFWWGHLRHDDVPADRVEAVVRRVRAGTLGLVALHSSCASKPFRALMGTSCEPGGWREDGRPERVEIKAHDHPIVRGVHAFTIPRTDMFAEPFAVPDPESVLLVSSWERGESVRSGLTWTVGRGRVAYLRTGHDAFPVLFHPMVRKLLANSAYWAGRRDPGARA